ncbi:MAG: Hint domain-containing protein, partial [Alphaproteobacteria bacterium]|nr:Hint domain-containing protein [Alphaproteobacteria bacterium]
LHDGADPATLTLAGDTTFIASGNLYNAGATVRITGAGALDASLVLDSGGLNVTNDSTLVVGVPIGSPANATGVLEVSEGGVLELQSSVAVRDSAMLFGGLLRIDDAKHFAAHITQFRSGATLELMGVTAAPPADLPVDSQSKLAEMPVMNGVTIELPYQPYAVTQLDGNTFITVGASVPSNVGGAPGGGTAPIVTVTGVSVPAGGGDTTSGTGTGSTPGSTTSVVSITHTFDPCFVTGTQIATEAGEVAVEALRPGMRVRTGASTRPVVWVGRRRVDLHRHADPAAVAPIRILAHAFGRNRPRRALWLSPDHAVFVAGVLIPIRCLVNGATIAREDRAAVVYHHVELDRHDVLLAEGLSVESYLDTGNRSAFDGAAALTLHPDFAPRRWDVDACAPLLTGGPIVAAVRVRLQARAEALGFHLTTDPGLRVCAGAEALRVGRDGYVLPRGVRRLHLHSRSVVPSEINPDVQDRRRLGLALRGVWFDERVADTAWFGTGFHAVEAEGPRWTTGDAVLHVPHGARRLRLGVDIWQHYWERSQCAWGTPAATAAVA